MKLNDLLNKDGDRKEFPDWEHKYQTEDAETMPWYHPELDHDLDRSLHEMKIESGSLLDLCTGPGTQAVTDPGSPVGLLDQRRISTWQPISCAITDDKQANAPSC